MSGSRRKAEILQSILESSRVVRASDLASGNEVGEGQADYRAAAGKYYDEPIVVFWSSGPFEPRKFIWRRRVYSVSRVMSSWVAEKRWWDDDSRVNRLYHRVSAEGRASSASGVYQIYLDRVGGGWFLESVVD